MHESHRLHPASSLSLTNNKFQIWVKATCVFYESDSKFCVLQVHEKASSDLSVVPENEPLDSDTEAEKNLVERIKSIKQEK